MPITAVDHDPFAQSGDDVGASLQQNFARNRAYVRPGVTDFVTRLPLAQERAFQQYMADKSDPQDIGRQDSQDYDMRGWWSAMQAGDPRAEMRTADDGYKHRSDYWKTPFHESFSNESQWAAPSAPRWDGDKLVDKRGNVVFQEPQQQQPDGYADGGSVVGGPAVTPVDYDPFAKTAFASSIRDAGEHSAETAVSPKGARGSFQVMPATAAKPGFGVKPAQNDSVEEYDRVGEDNANAMLHHFDGNATLASAAVNAGPGRVNQWITQFGDPRKGDLTDQEFAAKIPYQETRDYVGRVVPVATEAAPPPHANVVPVEGDPFAGEKVTPVEGNPFAAAPEPHDPGFLGTLETSLINAGRDFGKGIKKLSTSILPSEKSLPPGFMEHLIDEEGAPVAVQPTIRQFAAAHPEIAARATSPAMQAPIAAQQPIDIHKPLDLHSVAEKMAYDAVQMVPMVATSLGGIPSAALEVGVQSLGGNYENEIQRTPNDPAGATKRAYENAATDAAITALSLKAFHYMPFKTEVGSVVHDVTGEVAKVYQRTVKDLVKNLALQGLGIQGAISVADQGIHNFINGRPLTEGMPKAYLQGAVPTTLMVGLSHLVIPPKLEVGAPRAPEKGQASPYYGADIPGGGPIIEGGGGAGEPPAPAGRITGPQSPKSPPSAPAAGSPSSTTTIEINGQKRTFTTGSQAGKPPTGAPAAGTDIGMKFPDGRVERATVKGYSPDGKTVRIQYEDGSTAEHLTNEVIRDQTEAPANREETPPANADQHLTQAEREAPPLEESELVPPSARAARKIAGREPQPMLDPQAIHALDLAGRMEARALDPAVPMSTADRQAALMQVARIRQQFGSTGEETVPGGYRHPLAGEPARDLGELAQARADNPDGYQGEYERQNGTTPSIERNDTRETKVPSSQENVAAAKAAPAQQVTSPTPQQTPPARREPPPVTPDIIHSLAKSVGVPSDNTPAFMDQTEALTGKRHLEDMDPAELATVHAALSQTPDDFKAAPPAERAPIDLRPIKDDTAITASGQTVPVNYAVVEASDLVPSQTQDGRANPAYPAELQPRDRSRAVSETQIASIAQNLNPRLLDQTPKASDGAPIISPDGTVESGNGRTLAIQRAYDHNLPTADAYRAHLAAQGYPVEGMRNPVLVRVRTNHLTPEARQAFTRDANQSGTMAMSGPERAMADAKSISPAMLDLYRGGDIDMAQNRPFVRAFMNTVVDKGDHATMIGPDGEMSQDGIRRVQGALLAKAYGDPQLISSVTESAEPNIKAIGGALTDIAPLWATMREEAADGTIHAGMDQTKPLLDAVRLVQRARNEGRNVAEYVGQGEMFSGHTISPEAEGFLRLMFRNTKDWTQPTGRDKLAEALQVYAEEARKASAEPGFFGEARASQPADILAFAKERQFGKSEQPAADLFKAAPRGDGQGVRPSGSQGAGAASKTPPRSGSDKATPIEQVAKTENRVEPSPAPAHGKRMFPSYTTAELKTAAADTERNSPEQIALLKREITARESGASKHKVTPQIAPGWVDGKKVEPGTVGMMLEGGQVVRTVTGRPTTPFPKVSTGTNRKTAGTVKAVDRWLMQNALDEARARGDNFNARGFEHNLEKPSQADKDGAEYYLFDPAFVQPGKKAPFQFEQPGAGARTPGKVEDIAPEWSDWLAHHDVGNSPAEVSRSLRDYLLARGEKTKTEAIALYDGKEQKASHVATENHPSAIAFTPEMAAHMANPKNVIVGHHNHPNNRSLSESDVTALSFPGLRWVVAHGHGGDWFAASLTPRTQNMLKDLKPDAVAQRLAMAYDGVSRRVEGGLWNGIRAGKVTAEEADDVHHHIVNSILARNGIINYLSSKELSGNVGKIAAGVAKSYAPEAAYRQPVPIRYEDGIDRILAQLGVPSGQSGGEPGEAGSGTGAEPKGLEQPKRLEDDRRHGRDLIVQHNISVDKLLHADRMGGLAALSLAITKSAHPSTNFGEITLLGGPEMADPKAGAKVFGADIYSPRYPTISYRLRDEALKRLDRVLSPYRKGDERPVYSGEIDRPDDLRSIPAFERYAKEKSGEQYPDYVAMAKELLHQVGADERIFRGFTNNGNRSYTPHTLEKVVSILKKDVRGGENFNYGVGSLRSHYAPQFRSLAAIRSAKEKLVPKEKFDAVKKEVDDEFWKHAEALSPYYKYEKGFGFGDTVINVLSDAAKQGLPRALKEYGFEDVPTETQAEIAGFLNKLRNFPTEYFESKILRGVGLSEFRAAVVPHNLPQRARDILAKRGLEAVEYKRGDETDRRAAIERAAHKFDALFEEPRRYSEEPGAEDAQGNKLPQTLIPGAEPSAVQLAKARESAGAGRMGTKVQQKPPGGLFGAQDVPGQDQLSLFEEKRRYGTKVQMPNPAFHNRIVPDDVDHVEYSGFSNRGDEPTYDYDFYNRDHENIGHYEEKTLPEIAEEHGEPLADKIFARAGVGHETGGEEWPYRKVLHGMDLFTKTGTKAQAPNLPISNASGNVNLIAPGLLARLPRIPTHAEAALIEQINKLARQIVPTAKVIPASELVLNQDGKTGAVWGASYVDGPRKLIAWALGSPDAVGTFRHEAVHYLRNVGFFTKPEWAVLTKAAEDGNWIAKHEIDERYPNADHGEKIEEAIAEEFSAWKGKLVVPAPPVRRLLARIDTMLVKTRKYLQSLYGAEKTADDIFQDILDGKIGMRPVAGETMPSAKVFAQAAKTPDGPVETPEEGRDYIDHTAEDIAEHMREKGPGTYARTLQHLSPPGGLEVFADPWIQQEALGPRTVAEIDTKSGRLWRSVKNEDDEANRRLHDLRDHITKTFLKLDRPSQDRVNAVMEIDRLVGRTRVNDGRSIVATNEIYDMARGSVSGERIVLSPKETKAYYELQNMYRRAWDNIMEGAARRMGWSRPWSPAMDDNLNLIRQAVDTADHPRNRKAFQRVADVMQAMDEQRRAAYMPLMRFGGYYISVKPKYTPEQAAKENSEGGFPKSVWFEMVERPSFQYGDINPIKLMRIATTTTGQIPDYAKTRIAELKKKFPSDQYTHESGYLMDKPDSLRSLSIPAVEKLLMLMESGVMERLKAEASMDGFANKKAVLEEAENEWKKLYEELVDAVHEEMYEQLRPGFKKHSNAVPGYSGDWNRVLGTYMGWTSRHVARQIHGDDIERAYDDIQMNHPHQSIKEFWKNWKQDADSPLTPMSRISMVANQIGFLWTLALNPASTFSIMMHGPTYAIPVLSTGVQGEGPGIAFAKAYGHAVSALSFDSKQGAYIDVNKVGKTPDERAFLRQMERDGDLHAKGADDIRSMGEKSSGLWGDYAPHAKQVMDVVSSNIAVADQANRVAAALAAYRLARDGNLGKMNTVWSANQVWRAIAQRDGVSPETMGKFLMTQAVGEWGSKSRTKFGRTPFGRMTSALHGFVIRFISNLFKQMLRQGLPGRIALARTLVGLFAVAGLQGLPLVGDAENFGDWIWKLLRKHDPMLAWRLRAALADTGLGKTGADIMMRGPLSVLTGADFGSRLGFGDPITRDVMPLIGAGEEMAMTLPSIIAGIFTAAHKRAASHQPESAAAAFLPAGLKHPVQAAIDAEHGVKSQSGKRTYVPAKKFSAYDQVLESVGLTPLDVARAREKTEYQYRAKLAHGPRPKDMTP